MQPESAAFYVDHVPIDGRLILAPMDGFSDPPFRLLCRQFGSAISYIAFISARELLQDHSLSRKGLHFDPRERPVAIQLYDNDVARLLKAAIRVHTLKPDMIDINMGCSTRRGSGAGLLCDRQKIANIIGQLSTALEVPVTAKIRLGWDDDHRNHIDVAKIIEDNNGAMIAVHGRTCKQAFKGQADWDAIAEVKQAVSIPVIGNGDVKSTDDIKRFFAHTKCDGVMIGRAAIGNPWIFQNRSIRDVSMQEFSTVIHLHYERMIAEYGERLGLLLFRKHISCYLDHALDTNEFHNAILTAEDDMTLKKYLFRAGIPLPVKSDDDRYLPPNVK